MSLGCVAQLSEDAKRRLINDWSGGKRVDPLSTTLPFDAIELLTTTTHSYLEVGSSCFRRMFLYHISSDNRAVVALFVINESNAEVATSGSLSQVDRLFSSTPGRQLMEQSLRRPVGNSQCIGMSACTIPVARLCGFNEARTWWLVVVTQSFAQVAWTSQSRQPLTCGCVVQTTPFDLPFAGTSSP
jgi:hypothetical protein